MALIPIPISIPSSSAPPKQESTAEDKRGDSQTTKRRRGLILLRQTPNKAKARGKIEPQLLDPQIDFVKT
jgi:hypothetical protein